LLSLFSDRPPASPERVNIQPENSHAEDGGKSHGGETGTRRIHQKRAQIFEAPSSRTAGKS
jgi:hypothetical protein